MCACDRFVSVGDKYAAEAFDWTHLTHAHMIPLLPPLLPLVHKITPYSSGIELTYDYRFQGEQKLRCNCGAATCRGWVNEVDQGAAGPRGIVTPACLRRQPDGSFVGPDGIYLHRSQVVRVQAAPAAPAGGLTAPPAAAAGPSAGAAAGVAAGQSAAGDVAAAAGPAAAPAAVEAVEQASGPPPAAPMQV